MYISQMTIFLKKNTHNLLSINKAISLGSEITHLGVSAVPRLIVFQAHDCCKALQYQVYFGSDSTSSELRSVSDALFNSCSAYANENTSDSFCITERYSLRKKLQLLHT